MNLDYIKIKSNIDPLKIGRNRKNYYYKKNFISQEIDKNKDTLPKIKLNSLNITEKFSQVKNILYQKEKSPYKINLFNNPINNYINNIVPLKSSLLSQKKKNSLKYDFGSYKNRKDEYKKLILINFDNIKYKNDRDEEIIKKKNKYKLLRKIIEAHYNDEDTKRKGKNISENNELNRQKDEGKNEKLDNKISSKNSMFITGMNFLNKNKKGKTNKMNVEKAIDKANNNKESIFRDKYDYDKMNFKELIKHLEKNKRRIINNQNEINNMIKTTRETFHEIWNFNHK